MVSANYSLWEDVQELLDTRRQDDRREAENQAPKFGVSDLPEFRHRCEVRWLLSERTRRGKAGMQWLRDYLQSSPVKGRRERLEMDIRLQWIAGNRGEPGIWHQT
jgi:hypothetical protein